MNNKLRIPYGYTFSYFVDEDEYIDFVYENGTEDKIIWREYKKDIEVIKEPSKQELQQRIEMAIDYIEENSGMISKFTTIKSEYAQEELSVDQLDNLLEILKGDK